MTETLLEHEREDSPSVLFRRRHKILARIVVGADGGERVRLTLADGREVTACAGEAHQQAAELLGLRNYYCGE